jgi:hypothetical protein
MCIDPNIYGGFTECVLKSSLLISITLYLSSYARSQKPDLTPPAALQEDNRESLQLFISNTLHNSQDLKYIFEARHDI